LNFIFGIVCLFVCVCAFSLRRESPDMILGDKPLTFEVVLSHLSLESSSTTLSMSSFVKGVTISSKLCWVMRSCSSKTMLVSVVVPNMLLYSSHNIVAFTWWVETDLPSSVTRLVMVFNLYLSVAAA
jgi:hypothetical protein